MLGAAGCIAPEILATAGVIPQTPAEVTWVPERRHPPGWRLQQVRSNLQHLSASLSCYHTHATCTPGLVLIAA